MEAKNPTNKLIAVVSPENYNPAWPGMFENYKKEIQDAIGDYIQVVEHIGSTSIPGMFAKPEIDIMIGVNKIDDSKKYIDPLKRINFLYFPRFEAFVPERRYFRKSDGIVPLVHIHMVEMSSDFWREHILFRDYLKKHIEAKSEYENLKRELMAASEGDRDLYQDGKETFIKKILNLARLEI